MWGGSGGEEEGRGQWALVNPRENHKPTDKQLPAWLSVLTRVLQTFYSVSYKLSSEGLVAMDEVLGPI